ncbi:hypothetical protein DF122_38015 [Burkholderia pseudomallei]|nr:hypothetical protein DF122_38015 [Burkholderia pseudomallei]
MLFTGPAALPLRPSPHSAHLPSPAAHSLPAGPCSTLGAGTLRSTASLHRDLLTSRSTVRAGSRDLPPTNRASRSLVKFVFGEEDEHEEALYGTANHRVSEGS